MIWVDYAILAIIGISALISVLRGFVREALSLIGWIIAFWVALTFTQPVADLLVDRITVPSVRLAAAFFALFMGCLLVVGIVNFLAGKLIESTGLSGTDRMLGVVFGVARGAVVVCILVLLAGLTAVPQDPWWQQSVLMKHFERAAIEIRGLLPADVATQIKF